MSPECNVNVRQGVKGVMEYEIREAGRDHII